MDEAKNRRASYPALLWSDIKSRKAEFFVGLLVSVVCSIATVWLQYRDGMLEQRHFWDGVVTAAVPVFAIIVIFAVIEVCRAAVSIHHGQAARLRALEDTSQPEPNVTDDLASLQSAHIRQQNTIARQDDELRELRGKVAVLSATEPRSLNDTDRGLIVGTIQRLISHDRQGALNRRVTVFSVPGIHDSEPYSSQLRQAFRDGGIHSDYSMPAVHELDVEQYRKGITLKGWDGGQPGTRDVVRAALARVGIIVHSSEEPGDPDGIKLIVGARNIETDFDRLAEVVRSQQPRRINRLQLFRAMEALAGSSGAELRKHSFRIHPVPTVHDSGLLAAQLQEGFEHIGIKTTAISTSAPPEEYWSTYRLRQFGIWVVGDGDRDLEWSIAWTLRQLGLVTSIGELVAPEKHVPYTGFEIWIVVGDDGEGASLGSDLRSPQPAPPSLPDN